MSKIQVYTSKPTIDAREIHEKLKISTRYDMWIGRTISKYGFIENEDFCTIMGESSGGRRPTNYFVTIGMAKELCMIDNSEIGRKVRKAYISLEKQFNEKNIIRIAGIQSRKSLTDKIKDAGENERMHGHGYSTYTKLVYKLADINYIKCDNFRDNLTTDQLERVETIEKMIDSLMSMGRQYDEIKNTLAKIITKKEIN